MSVDVNQVIWGHSIATQTVLDTNDNSSGFVIIRVAFDEAAGTYHVWRDGVKIGSDLGPGLTGFAQNWLIFGDSGSATSVDGELDYFRWDTTGAFPPVGEIAAPTINITTPIVVAPHDATTTAVVAVVSDTDQATNTLTVTVDDGGLIDLDVTVNSVDAVSGEVVFQVVTTSTLAKGFYDVVLSVEDNTARITTDSLSILAGSEIAAMTGFEESEGFTARTFGVDSLTSGFNVISTVDNAHWIGGIEGPNYSATWTNGAFSGAVGALFGITQGQFVSVDPAGSAGISSVQFAISRTGTGVADPQIALQWTLDPIDGNETWRETAAFINPFPTGTARTHTFVVNEGGDIKLRWIQLNEGGHNTMIDIVIGDCLGPNIVLVDSVEADLESTTTLVIGRISGGEEALSSQTLTITDGLTTGLSIDLSYDAAGLLTADIGSFSLAPGFYNVTILIMDSQGRTDEEVLVINNGGLDLTRVRFDWMLLD